MILRPGDKKGHDHNFGQPVMDIALGRDHTSAAMVEVITGMAGADLLCSRTPSNIWIF